MCSRSEFRHHAAIFSVHLDLAVQNVRKQSGTAPAFVFPTTPFNIPVGQAHILPVTFTAPLPTGDPFEEFPFGCGFGPFGGTNGLELDYTSASMNWETASLAFTGKGKPPSIDVIPSEIDFGDVTVGCCSARARVAIYNSGAGIEITDPVSSPPLMTRPSIPCWGGGKKSYRNR